MGWTGHDVRKLRAAMRSTVLAMSVRLGVHERTVRRWEKQGHRAVLNPATCDRLDRVLDQASHEARRRFEVGSSAYGSQSAGHAGLPGLRGETAAGLGYLRRRDVLALMGTTAAAAVSTCEADAAPTSRVDADVVHGHRQVADAWASQYRQLDPSTALPAVASHADHVRAMLRDAASSTHDSLAAVAVDLHAIVGLWACHLDNPEVAYPYLATAHGIAVAGADTGRIAATLGALSYFYSSAPRGGHGGGPHQALRLLDQALALAASCDGFTRGWLATWRADQYVAIADLDAAQRDIETADRWLDLDDDNATGFFARTTYGYGMRGHLASVAATAAGMLGRVEEGQSGFAAVHRDAANSRRRVASLAHQALAHTTGSPRHHDPEAACDVLIQAVRLATGTNYRMGHVRARGVRRRFPTVWNNLTCVKDLDERLISTRQAGEAG